MLFPKGFIRFTGIELEAGADLDYGLRYGALLMDGWTILQFWANRKPVERKDYLALTLRVIIGYVVLQAHSVMSGLLSVGQVVVVWIMQVGLIVVMVYSYRNMRDVKLKNRSMLPLDF